MRNKLQSLIGVGLASARRHRIQGDKDLKGIKGQRAGKAESSRGTLTLKSAVQRRKHLAEARRRGGLMDFLMESEFMRQTIDEIPFTNEAIAKPR